MNLYFNDLTIERDSDLNLDALRIFARTFYALSKMTGEQHVWVPRSVKDLLRKLPWASDYTLWSWALSAFNMKTDTAPYEPDEVAERFLRATFEIAKDGENVRCDQMGLAVVSKPKQARKSLTVGVSTGRFWNALNYTVQEQDGTSHAFIRDHFALCVVDPSQVENDDVRDWCQEAYEIDLPETALRPEQKSIHLRDDHGQDVLMSLAKRIIQSPHVLEILNSLPFDSRSNRFVESCSHDGLIHLRIHWDPRGLGLVVKTTGTTLDQTERIAKVLMRKYGRR